MSLQTLGFVPIISDILVFTSGACLRWTKIEILEKNGRISKMEKQPQNSGVSWPNRETWQQRDLAGHL